MGICFEGFTSGNERVSLGCHDTHDVHRECAKPWFSGLRERGAQATCPTCRAVVDLSIVSDVLEITIHDLETAPMSGTLDDDAQIEELMRSINARVRLSARVPRGSGMRAR